jgi:hypothetical protein
LKKSAGIVIGVLLVTVLLIIAVGSGVKFSLLSVGNTPISGAEGVDLLCDRAVASGWIDVRDNVYYIDRNRNVPSVVGTAQSGDWIAWSTQDTNRLAKYVWTAADANNPGFAAEYKDVGASNPQGTYLNIRREPASPQGISSQGQILPGFNTTQIDWYSYERDKTTSGTSVTWKHYEVYVLPITYKLELSIRRENEGDFGSFRDFTIWFALNTNVWSDKFTKDQMAVADPILQNSTATVTAYDFRGASPIWAWVGGWTPWITSTTQHNWGFTVDDSVKGRGNNPNLAYTDDDLTPTWRAKIDEYTNINPSYAGTQVSLYLLPNETYTKNYAADVIGNTATLKNQLASEIGSGNLPETVYFPIRLIKYGGGCSWGGTGTNPAYFYPSSLLQVTVLYMVWGEWVYFWNQQEAQKYNYNWEDRSSVWYHENTWWENTVKALTDWWNGAMSWLGSPFNLAMILVVLVIIGIIVIAVRAPKAVEAVASRIKKNDSG